MKKAREIASQVLSIRVEKGIPVRQVLNSIAVLEKDEIPEDYMKLVLEEVNVKNVEIVSSLDEKESWDQDLSGSVKLDTKITPDLVKEGKLREFIREVQDLRKEAGLSVLDKINLTYKKDPDLEDIVSTFYDVIKEKLLAEEIIAGEETRIDKV